MAKTRGPKADHPIHPTTKEPVTFLYQNKRKDGSIKNYFFFDIQGKQISATSDIWKAIKRYNDYYSETKMEDMVEIPEDAQTIPIGRYGGRFVDEYVSKEWIIRAFQQILADDRKLVVDITGNQNYWDFENTPPKPPSLTCEEVLQEYLDLPREKPLNQDYRYKMIRHWNYFRQIIGKKFIRDISFNDIKKYRKTIESEASEKEAKSKIKRRIMWINERFQAIHDIPSKMKDTQEYKKDIITLLEHMEQLTQLDEGNIRAKAISKEQWDILYNHSESDIFIKCGLLLGLNCAMTWGDIVELKNDNFDFKYKTYIGTRSKNDIQNCAMLLPETIIAVKQYIKEFPNKDKEGRIFYYKPVNKKSILDDITNIFREWKNSLNKDKLKKVDNITHKNLRKSLRTTAMKAKCHPEYIKLVMGRKLEGSEEYYTEKDAIMTTEVIEAICQVYF